MKVTIFVCVLFVAFLAIEAMPRIPDDTKHMHSHAIRTKRATSYESAEEQTTEYWLRQAQTTLNDRLHQKVNENVAKNVIMFLGDGMSIPTLAAARIYMGQLEGKSGEECSLSFEQFPNTALSKTYCVDTQVADSACSATAYLCGVKGNIATIGVNAQVSEGDYKQGNNESNHVSSIARWSQLKNKRTGIVTTTRVTHASPSGAYASTANRDWECDHDIKSSGVDPKKVVDIAAQLVHGDTGSNFNVILGGGREKFRPASHKDEEGHSGDRDDGRDLIDEWQEAKADTKSSYVWNRDQLLGVPKDTDYLLGLFEHSHCVYNLERDEDEPSLTEMVEAAIQVLNKGDEGFFLFVEGGRIDHAHHDTRAHFALDETVEFARAIQRARDILGDEDTLIVVTADHAHTMTLNGYPDRGNDIFGLAALASDKLPFTTLSYANGPGYRPEENGHRHDVSKDNTRDPKYRFPAYAPLSSETHGGDDVGIFANGPWAHLFKGVTEQNVIPHIMAYASCVGDGITVCDDVKRA